MPGPVKAADPYVSQVDSVIGTYSHIALVTPSDTDELVKVTRGISITVEGALKVVTRAGETVVIPSGALAVKTIYPLRVKQVFSAGTGATGIIAYW